MLKLNVHEAKTHLSEHLERLERGELDVLIICRRNRPIAELRALAVTAAGPRPITKKDPAFKLSQSFFEPLPDELIESFEAGPR